MHHHRHALKESDIKSATARMSWWRAVVSGPWFIHRAEPGGISTDMAEEAGVDLIAVAGDPLADIVTLARPILVLSRGRIVRDDRLDSTGKQ